MNKPTFLRLLNRRSEPKLAVTYKDVVFSGSVSTMFESLRITNQLDFTDIVMRDGEFVWECGEFSIRTSSNPMVSIDPTQVVVEGDKAFQAAVAGALFESAEFSELPDIDEIELSHQYHEALNPALWEKHEEWVMSEEMSTHLRDIADAFFEFLEIEDLELEDIVLTGSTANFNWTEHSDIDLHLIVDFAAAEEKYGVLFEEYVNTKKSLWNNTRDISLKGIPVECYVENSAEEHISTGVYSLYDGLWIIEPKYAKPSIDDSAVRAKTAEWIREIYSAIRSDKIEVVERVIEKLRNFRQAGLNDGGEFSVENLTFKTLRNEGWIEKLYDSKSDAFDKQLSIEEEEWSALLGRG